MLLQNEGKSTLSTGCKTFTADLIAIQEQNLRLKYVKTCHLQLGNKRHKEENHTIV